MLFKYVQQTLKRASKHVYAQHKRVSGSRFSEVTEFLK